MTKKESALGELVELSHSLGEKSREFVICSEGNTSARIDDRTFFVKASGVELGDVSEENLVEVNSAKVLEMLSASELSDEEIRAQLTRAVVHSPSRLAPSVETLFHAYLLSLPDVNFVGHTHPISVLGILCSVNWRDAAQITRIFPDEVIRCGSSTALVEFAPPGIALGRAIRTAVEAYREAHGSRPKALLMQNHGLVALGETAKEVLSITAMWEKTARVLAGTFSFGGPNYLPPGR
jgi:rhamnose utilization protein RhaD (predicted bifunctional aldolase and dehydrogenase)